MVTGHGRATPLLWKTVASSTLKGLQHIWSDEEVRARLLALLDEHILPEADRTVWGVREWTCGRFWCWGC